MKAEEFRAQADSYRGELLDTVLPFWLQHGVDEEHGGFFSCLGRAGERLDTDKSGWVQGRFTWLLSRLHSEFGGRSELLDTAERGIQFMRSKGYCADGRMWFQLSEDGAGLRRRRYAYTEFFAAQAFAEWGRATNDEDSLREAERLFCLACDDMRGARGPSKVEPVRRSIGLGVPMITLGVSHVLEDCGLGEAVAAERAAALSSLLGDFTHEPTGCLLELVGVGEDLSAHLDGRVVNPGHSIEAAWFLLEEHRRRKCPEARDLALRVLDASWDIGWDPEHGGLLSLVDVTGAPVQEVWAELKYWWPHCEAIIAFLMAYRETGDQRYLDRWRAVQDWTYAHFPDTRYGEWYGYLRRDGSVLNPAKGNLWKGPFHVPRMLLFGSQLCAELAQEAQA